MRRPKSELAALDRKIAVELKPSDAEEAARAKVVTPTKGNGEHLDPPELICLLLGYANNPDHRKSRKQWWQNQCQNIHCKLRHM